MLKKYCTLILAVLVINLSLCSTTFANPLKEKGAAKLAAKVEASIIKLSVGKNSLVEVKLRDKTKLKGYVGEIKENSFVVVDDATGTSTEVSYSQAKQVKGNNLSTGVKIVIGIGITLGVLIIIALTGVLRD